MQRIIECSNLKKIYQNGETENKVLNNINLIVEQGDFISIMGTSGVGKSTLINILGLIDSDFEGAYRFNHAVVKEMNDDELSEYR
ncbi:ATP-binding cassette domain-containing protein, partial [Staphylococcus felis]